MRADNRTLIYATNGIALTPSDAHEGTVTIGLSATSPTVNSVLSWNGTQFVWTTISSISTLSWTITGNQAGLTGTKSGSYDLVTTGDITCNTLNYTTINPALVPYVGATADVNLGVHNLTTLGDLTCNTLNYTTLNPEVWRLDGQALGVKRTLGSADNFDIGFITNNLERLTILNSGNIGINRTAPITTLDINGQVVVNSLVQYGAGQHNVVIRAEAGKSPLLLVSDGGNAQMQFWKDTTPTSAIAYGLQVPGGVATDDLIFSTYNGLWSERFRILSSNGNVGISVSVPTSYLHIRAGTATAGTSPLKLTSGINLTAPESGAFEYNGTRLYFTPVAARETIAFLSDLTSGYVPYIGATANVDLGLFSLTANSLLVQNDFSITSVADNVFIDQLTSDKDLTIRYNDGGVTKTAFFIDASTAQIALAGTTIAAGYEVQVNGDFNVVGQGLVSSSTFPPFRANRTGQVLDLPFSAFSCISTKASDAGDGFGSGFVVEFTDTGGTFTLGQFAFARDGGDRKGRFVVQSNNGTVADAYSWNFQVRPDGTTYIGNAALNTLPAACTRIDPDGTLHVITDIGMTVGTGSDFQVSLSSDNVLIDNVTSNKNITVRVNKGGATTDLLLFNGTAGSMVVNDSVPLNFRDSAIGIYSQADTFMDLFADGSVRIGNSSAGAPTTYLAIDPSADTYWVGDGSGIPYGSCYGNEIGWSQAAAAQNVWYVISDADMTDGNGGLNLVTHDGSGKLTVTKGGRYQISYNITLESTVNGEHVLTGIELNGSGTAIGDGQGHFHVHGANEEVCMAGMAIVDLAASGTIEIAVSTTDTGTPTISVSHLNIVCFMVGGT